MKDPDITIYEHPNPQMKSFLLPEDISPPRLDNFENPLSQERAGTIKALGVIGAQIVRDIMAVPGVVALQMKPKEMRVKKEASCSWEEIQEKILVILQSALRRKQMKIVK